MVSVTNRAIYLIMRGQSVFSFHFQWTKAPHILTAVLYASNEAPLKLSATIVPLIMNRSFAELN